METNIIHNQDCLEGLRQLPDKCIDLVVTDPPYKLDIENTKRALIVEIFDN